MNIVALLVLIGLAIWVTMSYDSVGTVGLVGLAIAGSNLSLNMGNWLHWVVAVTSAILFAVGMFAPLRVDDWFHWSALLVNLIPWMVGWTFWTTMATVPLVFIIIGSVLAPIGLVWVGTRLTTGVSKWRRSRHPNPAPAAPASPVAAATTTP